MSVANSLLNSELFRNLESRHVAKLSPLCRGLSYREGMTIFKEGDEATELYILTEGRVALEMDIRPVPNQRHPNRGRRHHQGRKSWLVSTRRTLRLYIICPLPDQLPSARSQRRNAS